MEKRPIVVLLGDSVLIDGVAVGLADRHVPGMIRINRFADDITERLKSLKPDMIVFELDTPCASSIFSLLREQPGILLLGLDLNCSQVLVLNSHQHVTRTVSELYCVVQLEACEQVHISKGGESTEQDAISENQSEQFITV